MTCIKGLPCKLPCPGQESPLKFLVTTGGNYTIKATRGDVSRDMNGSARVSYYGVLEGRSLLRLRPG